MQNLQLIKTLLVKETDVSSCSHFVRVHRMERFCLFKGRRRLKIANDWITRQISTLELHGMQTYHVDPSLVKDHELLICLNNLVIM